MSVPVQATYDRSNLDSNQRTIARSLLTLVENLQGFNAFIMTIPSGATDALTEPPYSYTADEAYALRLFAQHAATYATIFEAGGTLSAGDATALHDLTHKSAGAVIYAPTGM